MIKYKFIKLTLAVGVAIAGSNIAVADFNIYADPAVVAERIKKDDRHSFSQIGGSLEKSKVVKAGFGPLKIAIDHLIPKDWDIKMTSDIGLEDSIVKWGVGTWPYALESISVNNDMNVVINWERRYVSIDSSVRKTNIEVAKMEEFKNNHMATSDKPKMDLLSTSTTVSEKVSDSLLLVDKVMDVKEIPSSTEGEAEELSTLDLLTQQNKDAPTAKQMIEEMSPKDKYELEKKYNDSHVLPLDTSFEAFVLNKDVQKHEYMQMTYILKTGQSLQENIRRWAQEMPNDWTVKWDAKKDFMMDKDIKIENTFIDVFPTVEDFYINSKYPIKIKLYLKNNIVHVYNKELKLNHKEAGIK